MNRLICLIFAVIISCCTFYSPSLKAEEPPCSSPSALGYRTVKKDQVPACYTKEAWDKFGEYANENNLDAIDLMLILGQIELLKKGEKVELLDYHFSYAKIKRANGKVMYTAPDWLE